MGVVAALGSGRRVLDVHADADHNRSVVTLAAASAQALSDDLTAQVATAMERIDIGKHVGVHPRVGAADVVPIVPLGETTMAQAVEAARELGQRLWRELALPVFFYGEAAGGRRLADIRRRGFPPDLGGPRLHPSAGAVCVGARGPLVAYNVTFQEITLDTVRRLVREMRRMPGVQALAFPLRDGRLQLSMNLTRPEVTGPEAAYQATRRLSGREGTPELVGLCPVVAAGPGCEGGLLEARLASTAAGWAAERARQLGGDERLRLANRLDAEASSLRSLGASPEEVLAGAERAAALVRVQQPAGIAEAETNAFLMTAAAGFRQALGPATEVTARERIALLDRWLAQ